MRMTRTLGWAAAAAALAVLPCRGDGALDKALAAMPPKTAADREQVCQEALGWSDNDLSEVAAALTPEGGGKDNPQRYLIACLAWHATRPGAERERTRLGRLLASALDAEADREPAVFLIEQLRIVRSPEAVPALAKRLQEEPLADPAARALAVIGTRAAAAALEAAIASPAPAVRLAAAQASGELPKPPVKALLPLLDSADPDLQLATARALAASADARAAARIEAYALAADGLRAPAARAAYLDALGNMIRGGARRDAAKRARAWLKHDKVASDPALAGAGLALLKDAAGSGSQDELFAAVSGSPELRAAALRLLNEFPEPAVSRRLAAEIPRATADAQAGIVLALSQRTDPAARTAVLAAMRDTNEVVRVAAIDAATARIPAEAAPVLVGLLASGSHDPAHLKASLLRIPGTNVLLALQRALPGAPAPAQAVAMDVLAARRASFALPEILGLLGAESPEVSAAAGRAVGDLAGPADVPALLARWKTLPPGKGQAELLRSAAEVSRKSGGADAAQPFVDLLPDATPDQRVALLGALRMVGGAQALQAVAADARSADAAARRAAIKTLSEWPDSAALPALLEAGRGGGDPGDAILALRGYLGVLRKSDLPPATKLKGCQDARALVRRPEEKRLLLAGLAELRTDASLAEILAYLDDGEVRNEAAGAVLALAQPAGAGAAGIGAEAARQALRKVADSAADDATRAQARALLDEAPNLALKKPVTASVASQGPRVPELAVDGKSDLESAWWGARWPADLVVDLGSTQRVAAAHAVFHWGENRYYQYRVDVSPDAAAWQTVVDRSSDTTPSRPEGFLDAFPPVAARYARLTVLKNSANEAVHVVEFRVLGEAASPPGTP